MRVLTFERRVFRFLGDPSARNLNDLKLVLSSLGYSQVIRFERFIADLLSTLVPPSGVSLNKN
jgi:hypothetical protein